MKEKFYITTAIDYSNAPPHLGHAYEKISADAIARHFRQRNKDVIFLTGLDEHGSKIEKTANEKGLTPKEHCDQIAEAYLETWNKLNISHDIFYRTHSDIHIKSVQKIFEILKEKGDLYIKEYQGLYCNGCEAFYLEKDLDENGFCPDHKRKPDLISEKNYFFKISKYKNKIKEHILNNIEFIQPETRRNEILAMLDDFEDISVTRESVKWGISVPNEEKQVIYVWLDALTNYINALGFFVDIEKDLKNYWPANIQIIGKDIIKFHCIIWPSILLALDLPLPKTVFAHGFITIGGSKISKTVGNIVKPSDLIDKYQADGLRYFLLREINYGNDGDFNSEFNEDGSFNKCEILENRVNADLANNLGNSLNRIVASILAKNCDSIIPNRNIEAEKDFEEFSMNIKKEVISYMDNYDLQNALIKIWEIVNKLNKYIDTEAPWNLAKQSKEDESLLPYFHGVLYTCLETLRVISFLLYPFIPTISEKIWYQLGIEEDINNLNYDNISWGQLKSGLSTRKSDLIYQRIDSNLADKNKKKKGA